MSQPLVSVLITTYNREKYVSEAIESVISSTYANWELIVVDDCSIDNSVLIANTFACKDPRIKVFVNEKNLGDYANRNMAASYAKGKYLKYLDADDYLYPTGLEVLVNMLEQFPEAGYGLCSFSQDKDKPFPKVLLPQEAYYRNYFLSSIFHKAPLSSVIRKDAFTAVGGFDNVRMAGDFNMWHKLSLKYPVALLPDGIVWYREHDDQEINKYFDYVPAYWMIKEKYLRHSENPLSKEEKQLIYKSIKKEKIQYFLSSLKRRKVKSYFSNIKRLQKSIELV